MELTIKGENISEPISKCIYTENATGRADALDITVDDSSRNIESLRLKKGDVISVSDETQKSGKMYVSHVFYTGNTVMIRALSTDAKRFTEKTQYKKAISFEEIAKEVANETGYGLNMVHTLNLHYQEVQRQNETPVAYLARRLALEGFQMRIYDNTIIIFDERIQEQKDAVDDLSEDKLQQLAMSTSDAGLIASIRNRCKAEGYTIDTYTQSGLPGKALDKNILCSSIAESERFCKALMREANKYEYLTSGRLEGLNKSTGQTIEFETNKAGFSGKKYIYKVAHDLVSETQMLYMRNVIAGGY